MTKDTLKEAINTVAKEEGITEIEAISMMQTGASIKGDGSTLETLIEIKNELIEKMFA